MRLAELGGASVVLVTQSETSTGVVSDVRAFATTAKEAGALIAVDAISSLGAVPCETDEWGLDSVADDWEYARRDLAAELQQIGVADDSQPRVVAEQRERYERFRASSVDPARSANTTVTSLRSSAWGSPSGAPQFGQNRASWGAGAPQFEQVMRRGYVGVPTRQRGWVYSISWTVLPSGSWNVAYRA